MKEFDLTLYSRESKASNSFLEYFNSSGFLEQIRQCKARDDESKSARMGTVLNLSHIPEGQLAQGVMDVLGFPIHGLADLDESGLNVKSLVENCPCNFRWRALDADLVRVTLGLDDMTRDWARLAAVASNRMAREVLMNQIVEVLDREQLEDHKELVKKVENALENETLMAKWKNKFGIDGSALDLQYCLVESGLSGFTLDTETEPTEDNLCLSRGAVCFGLALKYTLNLANITRTILMDVGELEQKLYKAALDLQTHLETLLTPGKKYSEIYQLGMDHAREICPELAAGLIQDFGGPINGQLVSPGFRFTPDSEEILQGDMAIFLTVAGKNFANVTCPFAIWLGDTYYLPQNGEPPVLWTGSCPKKLDDIRYDLKPEDAVLTSAVTTQPVPKGTSKKESPSSRPPSQQPSAPRVSTRVRTRRTAAGLNQVEQEKLLMKQRELRKKKQQELLERFRDGGTGFARDKKDIKKLNQIVAYRDHSEYPKDLRPNKLFVDTHRSCLLIPLGQRHVPFHFSTIRTVVHQDEDGSKNRHTVRITFNGPWTFKAEESPLPDLSTQTNSIYLKEITVKTHDPNIALLCKNLKEQIRNTIKDFNRRDEDVTQQQALVINKTGKRVFLRNLMVRHSGAHGRKSTGQLEAHVNGLRYSVRNENIDILYSNIRHAFFQPVSNEMIVLLHFHLKVTPLSPQSISLSVPDLRPKEESKRCSILL